MSNTGIQTHTGGTNPICDEVCSCVGISAAWTMLGRLFKSVAIILAGKECEPSFKLITLQSVMSCRSCGLKIPILKDARAQALSQEFFWEEDSSCNQVSKASIRYLAQRYMFVSNRIQHPGCNLHSSVHDDLKPWQ